MRSLALTNALLALLASPAAGQDGEWVTPCAQESEGWIDALRRINELEAEVAALEPADDPSHALDLLRQLRETPCIAIADAFAWSHWPSESALALRSWWRRGGGDALRRSWTTTEVFIPPEDIPALTIETAPSDHPLRSLLCSAADESCGRETRHWRVRAEQAFARLARIDRDARERWREECAASVQDAPEARRYSEWIGCLEPISQGALALGNFRAPTDGWLLIRGNRSFLGCAEVDAYDLATGTAYVARRCSRDDGARLDEPVLESGRIPIEPLREAAWMMLFARYVQELQLWVNALELPRGVTRMAQRTQWPPSHGVSMCGSSHSTTLEWVWLDATGARVRDELVLSGCEPPGRRHAIDLLEVAEAAFTGGCPIVPPPPAISTTTPRYVRAPDPDPLLELIVRAPRARCARSAR